MNEQVNTSTQSTTHWRIKLGITIFVLSIVLPLVGIPTVVAFDFSEAFTASVTGALLVGAEVLGILAIAVMGKEGYISIQNFVLRLLKKYGPPNVVSQRRYRIGLIMFCVPIVFGWVAIYANELLPNFIQTPIPYAIAGDVLLLVSLFVLGGNFWDKVRSLFVYDAEAHFK